MPKNPVTDPITDQEIAFARLILSGTMTDRDAAEAAGLNPSTAAYTKSKPRVRDYMSEHRAAVNEKLADGEAEALRNLNRSRDQIRNQILDRLWQLANLNAEQTKGSIAGQIKAMSMILAIEGLIPDRGRSPIQAQPATPRVPERTTPPPPDGGAVSLNLNSATPANPFVYPEEKIRVPAALGAVYDANLNPVGLFSLAIPPPKAAASSGR